MKQSESIGIEVLGYKQELSRSLSTLDLVVYGLVFIVPLAPIATFGILYNASGGMVPLIYLIGLVAMVFTALSYMALGREFPVAGSVYTYASRSLGPIAGFLSGWAMLLDYMLLPALNYVICTIAMHSILPSVPKSLWVALLLAMATAINFFGIRTTARFNFVLLATQYAIIAVFIAVGAYSVMHKVAGAHLSILPVFNAGVISPHLIFGAMSLAVLSFLGFDAISTLSEEARDGPSSIARATILSLCLSASLFVVVTYIASLFVLGQAAFPSTEKTETAFYGIATIIGGEHLKFLLTVPGVVLANIAGALTAQAATARLIFGMARDGRLPRSLSHVHSVHKVPDRAIFLTAVITLGLSVYFVDRLELLASMVSIGALLGFLMLHVSVVVHFYWQMKSRNLVRHLLVPIIGLMIIVLLLLNAQTGAKIAGGIWMGTGLALALVLVKFGRRAALRIDS